MNRECVCIEVNQWWACWGQSKGGGILQSLELPVELKGLTMSEQLEVKRGHFIETSFGLSD